MGRGRGRGREVVVKGGFVDFDLTVRGGGGGRVVSSRDFGIRRGCTREVDREEHQWVHRKTTFFNGRYKTDIKTEESRKKCLNPL
jgi:hypothetical protein